VLGSGLCRRAGEAVLALEAPGEPGPPDDTCDEPQPMIRAANTTAKPRPRARPMSLLRAAPLYTPTGLPVTCYDSGDERSYHHTRALTAEVCDETYTHVLPEVQRLAADAMDRALGERTLER
jgi:hypothetical protein